MPIYTVQVTTPEDVPVDVLIEHLSYNLRAFLLDAPKQKFDVRIVSKK